MAKLKRKPQTTKIMFFYFLPGRISQPILLRDVSCLLLQCETCDPYRVTGSPVYTFFKNCVGRKQPAISTTRASNLSSVRWEPFAEASSGWSSCLFRKKMRALSAGCISLFGLRPAKEKRLYVLFLRFYGIFSVKVKSRKASRPNVVNKHKTRRNQWNYLFIYSFLYTQQDEPKKRPGARG